MASTYNYPEDYITWFIKGNHLAVVTLKGDSEGTYHSKYGQYKPIDEAVTDGLLLHYYAEPNAVTAITDTPDVDNVFHTAIIDYVKARLYEDDEDLEYAAYYRRMYEQKVKKFRGRRSAVRHLAVTRL